MKDGKFDVYELIYYLHFRFKAIAKNNTLFDCTVEWGKEMTHISTLGYLNTKNYLTCFRRDPTKETQ